MWLEDSHIDVNPLIFPVHEGPGITVTLMQIDEPAQSPFVGVTHIWPETEPTLTEIVDVPCPEFKVQPEGKVQLYEVAFVQEME